MYVLLIQSAGLRLFLIRNLIMCPAVVYRMTQAIHHHQDQNLTVRRGNVPKTTIKITPHTKDYLVEPPTTKVVGFLIHSPVFVPRVHRLTG